MGLISPGGQNLLDFLELRQVLSTYDGALRDPLWWPQERPVPMRVPEVLSGFLTRGCQGLRPCVESGMSGNFLSCSKGVNDPLEVPVVRCDWPREASAEMGLISPGGQNLLDFLELRQVL